MSAVDRAAAARSAKWSVLENGLVALISFLALVICARFVSVAEYGVFSIALAITELLAALVTMLFHDALVQRREVDDLHYDSAFTATLLLSGVLAAACWFLAPMVLAQAGVADAGRVLASMALCLPLAALSATLVARRRRELGFGILAFRQVAGRLAGAATGVGLVVLGFGLWGLVAQYVVMVAVGSLVLWTQCADRPRLRIARAPLRELLGFGLTSVSALMLHFCIKRAFIIVAGVALGTHGAGLLNLAFRAVDTLWALAATAVSQIALPLFSAVREDERRFKRAFAAASAFACMALYFGFVLLAAVAPEAVQVLFGPQWLDAVPYVTALALQILVQARRLLLPSALIALGRPRDVVACQLAELGFMAAALAIFGVPSVAWALGLWLARDILGTVLEALLLRRAARLAARELLESMWVPLAAAIAMFAAVWIGRDFLPPGLGAATRLAWLGSIGAVVFLACVAAMRRGLLVEMSRFVRSGFLQRSRA